MDCAQIADDLVLLLDDALDAWRADSVNAHFRECPQCSDFYRALREQMVLHRWAAEPDFAWDEAHLPDDVPDYGALSARLTQADLGSLGRVLFEILKAEFLHDYGDGLEASETPIEDPRAQRGRGADLVEELRGWHDADQVDGVDLDEVARRLSPPGVDEDRLGALVAGMEVVARLSPTLVQQARFYEAIAHVKAGREPDASALLRQIVAEAPPPLAWPARICLATLPALIGGRPEESIDALEACLGERPDDAVVHYNLANARFVRDGALDAEARRHLERARALDPSFVMRQLARPSERALLRASES